MCMQVDIVGHKILRKSLFHTQARGCALCTSKTGKGKGLRFPPILLNTKLKDRVAVVRNLDVYGQAIAVRSGSWFADRCFTRCHQRARAAISPGVTSRATHGSSSCEEPETARLQAAL